jgi:hypothetical protein
MVIKGLETQEQKDVRLSDEALNKAKFEATSKVNPYRESLLAKGFLYSELHIQCDLGSQNNLTGMVMKSSSRPYPVKWRTYENEVIEIADAEELDTLSDLMMDFVEQVFMSSWIVKDTIKHSVSVEEIETLISDYLV